MKTTTNAKNIRFTDINPNVVSKELNGVEVNVIYELGMYSTKIEYLAGPVVVKGKPVSQDVEIESYGLFIWVIREINGEVIKSDPIDMGVLSAYPNHVNAFVHQMCRLNEISYEIIEESLEGERESWCDGWPDPFAKKALSTLQWKLSEVKLSKMTDRIWEKRNEGMRRNNPFRNLPVYSTRGLDV